MRGMSRRFIVGTSCLALGSGLALLSTGCSANSDFRSNPTPELDTLSQRHEDIDNRLTITSDTNFRILNEDIGRFFLLDRPSRLSPRPMPY